MFVLLGGVFAIFGAMPLMLANFVEQFNDMFDTSYTSRAWRTKAVMQNAMRGGKWNSAVKKQMKRLEKHGISVVEDSEGGSGSKNRPFHLEYKNSNGEKVTVDADSFFSEYNNNREFRTLYNKATKPITGRIGAWVDNSLAKFFDKHGLGKNLWKDWKNKLADNTKNRLKSLRETIEKRRGNINLTEETQTKSPKENPEDPDNPGGGGDENDPGVQRDPSVSDGDGESLSRGGDVEANKTAIRNRVQRAMGTVSNKTGLIGIITTGTCAAAMGAAVLSAIKASLTIEDSMNQFQGLAEGSDKARTEDSPYSPVNTLATSISQPDKDGNTVLNSASMVPILSAGTQGIDSNDASLRSTNVEAMYTEFGIGGINGAVSEVVIGCAVAQLATATVSLIANVVAMVLTGGGWALFSWAIDGVGSDVISFAFQAAALTAFNIVIDRLAASITSNECNVDQTVTESQQDEDGKSVSSSQKIAACYALGGSAMLFGNAHFGGGSAGDQNKVMQEYSARQVALEWEAEVDRENFDPLDTSNKNTFLGSLARSVATPIAQMKTPAGIFGALSGVASNSMASLLPSANAIETAQYVENIKGDCPSAEKIGAIADDNCHVIIITDMDTEDLDPDDLDAKLQQLGAVDENGNPKGNYKKYIEHWVIRETPVGMVDNEILQDEMQLIDDDNKALAIWKDAGIDVQFVMQGAWDILGLFPVVGELEAMSEAGRQLAAIPEAIGQNYVATDGDNEICVEVEPGNNYCLDRNQTSQSTANVVSWNEEYKYYQRAVEDDRLMQSWDPDYNSVVLQTIAQYEAENPVDNTLEGWLARQTGYPKETISWALTEAEYWTYLADYEAPKLEEEKEFEVKDVMPERVEMPEEVVAKAEAYIVYDDLRGRIYTV